MKAKHDKPREKAVFRVQSGPAAEIITCPACGHEIALWTEDDAAARCMYCGRKFFRHETTVH